MPWRTFVDKSLMDSGFCNCTLGADVIEAPNSGLT